MEQNPRISGDLMMASQMKCGLQPSIYVTKVCLQKNYVMKVCLQKKKSEV